MLNQDEKLKISIRQHADPGNERNTITETSYTIQAPFHTNEVRVKCLSGGAALVLIKRAPPPIIPAIHVAEQWEYSDNLNTPEAIIEQGNGTNDAQTQGQLQSAAPVVFSISRTSELSSSSSSSVVPLSSRSEHLTIHSANQQQASIIKPSHSTMDLFRDESQVDILQREPTNNTNEIIIPETETWTQEPETLGHNDDETPDFLPPLSVTYGMRRQIGYLQYLGVRHKDVTRPKEASQYSMDQPSTSK